jgi:hypothetical protein
VELGSVYDFRHRQLDTYGSDLFRQQKADVNRRLRKLILEVREFENSTADELTMWLALRKGCNQLVVQAPDVGRLHSAVLKVRVILQQEDLEGQVSF